VPFGVILNRKVKILSVGKRHFGHNDFKNTLLDCESANRSRNARLNRLNARWPAVVPAARTRDERESEQRNNKKNNQSFNF
jgi:hypothetical protein